MTRALAEGKNPAAPHWRAAGFLIKNRCYVILIRQPAEKDPEQKRMY
jgi:hypothetical protein